MLRSLKLEDYILKNPPSISYKANLFEAITAITEQRISGISVVDEDGILVGMLSELDCLEAIIGAAYNEEVNFDTVEKYMTKDVKTAGPHYDIVSVAADMLACKHRRRPVVENGKLIGLVSCQQLLRVFKEFNNSK